jgi:outer membrane protein OmpA-like peptidoglycan-associated protein
MDDPERIDHMATFRSLCLVAASVGIVVLLETGCATKKYVKQGVDPISGRVDELSEVSKKNEAAIKDVDGRAQSGIQAVQAKANEVDQKAGAAGQKADQASEMARNNETHLHGVETNLNDRIASIDNYKQVSETSIQFKFDGSELTDEARAKLDELAGEVKDSKNYVLEIKGFTDRTGDEKYNLGLSHRRSETVVRYLSQQHQVPLFRMFVLGLGESGEVQDNKTREGRAANRRVDIVLMRNGSESPHDQNSSVGSTNPEHKPSAQPEEKPTPLPEQNTPQGKP